MTRQLCLFLSMLASLAAAQQCANLASGACVSTAGCTMCLSYGGCVLTSSLNATGCPYNSCISCSGSSGDLTINSEYCPSDCGCRTSQQSGGGTSPGTIDSNGSLGAGIIVLIVFLVLLIIVLPAALAIAYFFCGCALCGRSRAGKVFDMASPAATPAQGVAV